MDGFELIKATDESALSQCLKVRNDVFTVEMNVPHDIEVDEYDILNGRCEHFLMKLNGESVGAVRCYPESDVTVRLQRFCVYKKYRKSGVGRAALEELEKLYREYGVSTLTLDAKLHASGFYAKCGFQKVSDVFIEADVPHIKMKKHI